MLFAWNDTYKVNIGKIDEQHKKLFSMANELYDAVVARHGKDVLGKILASLIDYTANHFATEEEFMTKHGYPAYQTHKAKHEDLKKQVLDFQRLYKEGKANLDMELFNFLKKWLLEHILSEDKKYAPFLNSKGVV